MEVALTKDGEIYTFVRKPDNIAHDGWERKVLSRLDKCVYEK